MLTPNIRIRTDDPRELQILNTSLNLFIRVGLNKVTLQNIMKAAGVSKSVLYRFYESKQDLMATVLFTNEVELAEALKSCYNDRELLEVYIRFRLQSIDKYLILSEIEKELQDVTDGAAAEKYLAWKRLYTQHVDLISRQTSQRRQGETSGYNYALLWSLIHGAASLSSNPFFHQLIEDRRGFTRFLTDAAQKLLDN